MKNKYPKGSYLNPNKGIVSKLKTGAVVIGAIFGVGIFGS